MPSNRGRSPSIGNAGIMVFSAVTGEPLAFIADEHYLTDARTAAAGALATELLASPEAATVAVLGAGVQVASVDARTLVGH